MPDVIAHLQLNHVFTCSFYISLALSLMQFFVCIFIGAFAPAIQRASSKASRAPEESGGATA